MSKKKTKVTKKKTTKTTKDAVVEFEIVRTAVFSHGGTFRYSLGRVWDKALPLLTAIMINPSKADAKKDDATTTFMLNWASRYGFGRYVAVNLFALVGTDPKCLLLHHDPSGPDNDKHIKAAIKPAYSILVAWGGLEFLPKGSTLRERPAEVLQLLKGRELMCFGRTKNGGPRFPRALGLDAKVVSYP